MADTEQHAVRIDTRAPSNWHRQGSREVCPLFADDSEQVILYRLAANELLFEQLLQGFELLVLEGSVTAGGQTYEPGSWLRMPTGQHLDFIAGQEGTTVYLKTGHLVQQKAEV